MRLFSPAGFSNKLLVWLCKLMTCSTGGVTSLLCAILAGRDSQWRAYDVGSQLPDIRCYPSVQKGKADFALIAKGPLGLRGPKITLVIWSKSVDKHLTLCTHRGSNWGSLEEGLPSCRMPETPRRSGMQPVVQSTVSGLCASLVYVKGCLESDNQIRRSLAREPDVALAARRCLCVRVPVVKFVNYNRRVTSPDYRFDHVQ